MDVVDRICEQIQSHPVMIYIKGTPQFPMCGFSSRTVEALKSTGVEFAYVDVLRNTDIREALPGYSDWPTFPQVFVNGELVGGCDIILELTRSGELQAMVDAAARAPARAQE